MKSNVNEYESSTNLANYNSYPKNNTPEVSSRIIKREASTNKVADDLSDCDYSLSQDNNLKTKKPSTKAVIFVPKELDSLSAYDSLLSQDNDLKSKEPSTKAVSFVDRKSYGLSAYVSSLSQDKDLKPEKPSTKAVIFVPKARENENPKGIKLIDGPINMFNDDLSFIVSTQGHLQLIFQENKIELCNFYIVAEKIEIHDNGLYQEIFYVFRCILENGFEEKTISILGSSLNNPNWIIEKLSIKYYIAAYTNAYNLFRIYLSKQFKNTKVEFKYNLVGWKYIDNKYVYLHGNGAIGSNVKNLKGSLDKKIETDNSLTAITSFKGSLSLINLSDNLEKTLPLFLYSHLAIMKEVFNIAGVEPKFLIWCYGLTGSMKTSVCKIFFNIFNRYSNPVISSTFKDTSAAVEIKAFEYKDSVLLLDDYHPTTSSTEKKTMEALASHVLRMYGDGITRSRATKTMGKQKEFLPRGLCVITGEDKLGGESTVARYIGIEVTAGDYKTDILSFHQNNPLILSTHMYYFINWVSDNFDKVTSFIKNNFENYRNSYSHCFRHKRLNESYAILQITAQLLLEYSVNIGYSTPHNVTNIFNDWSNIISQVIMLHEHSNVEENPAIMYLQAIDELLSSNKCILLSKDDTVINKSNVLGFKDNDFYHLLPETAFAQVRSFWKGQGLEFPVSNDQANKALDNLGTIRTSKEGGQTKRTIKASHGTLGRKRYLTIDVKKMAEILNNI